MEPAGAEARPVLTVIRGKDSMKEISSSENPSVKKLAALGQKKQRDKLGLYVAEGPNLVREALDAGVTPEAVFFRRSVFSGKGEGGSPGEEKARGPGEYAALLERLSQSPGKTAVISLEDEVFHRAAQTETPQGVMAIVPKRTWTPEAFFGVDGNGGNVLVLDRLQDPGNLGTVLRTARGAGFQGAVVMKGCGDLYSPKVVRACAGTLFWLPALFCDRPEDALALLRAWGKRVFASALKDSRIYYKCDLRENVALVIGNEGNGVCQAFLAGAEERLTIPMEGGQESLNAAVAAGILMYETVRQRNGG